MIFFEARDVSKKYANHLALDKVSIEVPENGIFGLLGPNGAGKTSLIRIINQITAPDEGALFMQGKPLRPAHIAQIGYLPEERGLYKKMKVGEQAMYLAQLKGVDKQTARKRLVEPQSGRTEQRHAAKNPVYRYHYPPTQIAYF